jgi:hypothetical protein
MFKKILITLLILILVFACVVALQPADFRISRSATISAQAETVFNQVNDFNHWNAWSPWAKLDPNAKNTFEGPSSGVGAGFSWAGNNKVGEGRMTITESRPYDLVRIKLDFIKPFEATNTTEFTFSSSGDQTLVTWTMFGKNNFISKAISLFINCDQILGPEFEKGLAQMKTVAEGIKK